MPKLMFVPSLICLSVAVLWIVFPLLYKCRYCFMLTTLCDGAGPGRPHGEDDLLAARQQTLQVLKNGHFINSKDFRAFRFAGGKNVT